VKAFGIDKYNCIIDDDYELYGNFYRRNMSYLELKLWKCQNNTKSNVVCEDQAKIDSYLQKETLSFAFVNTMFVTDDYEQPFHNYIDDSVFFELDPSVIKKANFLVQKSEASLQD
jgi:hypothetical protein